MKQRMNQDKDKKGLESNYFIEFEAGFNKHLEENSDNLSIEDINTLITSIANGIQNIISLFNKQYLNSLRYAACENVLFP